MSQKHKKNQEPDILQVIVVGIFKMIWWILTLPFKGLRRGKSGLSVEKKNYIASKRQEIIGLSESQSIIELKHAVMEADKLVDFTLKNKGFAGETFADRLRSAESSMSKDVYNSVWTGHKVRNQIAHESESRIEYGELRGAIDQLLKYTRAI
ncbi:MAG: hypothetical protein WC227_01640 [Patescibacteria group bacterium]|jgi:hypothetical protein